MEQLLLMPMLLVMFLVIRVSHPLRLARTSAIKTRIETSS